MEKSIDDVIREVATQQGMSEREVLAEMQEVIDAGYCCQDMDVQAKWASMPFDGKPTPQELLSYLSERLRQDGLH